MIRKKEGGYITSHFNRKALTKVEKIMYAYFRLVILQSLPFNIFECTYVRILYLLETQIT